MSIYVTEVENKKSAFLEFYESRGKKVRKSYKRALRTAGATDEQLQNMKNLLGYDQSCSLSTDARLADLERPWEWLFSAICQLKRADSRMQTSFKRYLIDPVLIPDQKPDDLKALKRLIEPQLKREFDAYVAKFAHLIRKGAPTMAVNVIGFSLDALAEPARHAGRRVSKRSIVLKPVDAIAASSKARSIAVTVAEFLQSSEPGTDNQPDPRANPEIYINALIYRALMQTDRIFFGHGVGRKVVRSIVAQMLNQAAASDVLDRSPLQPEGVMSFLASLPINGDGTKATLPSIKLP